MTQKSGQSPRLQQVATTDTPDIPEDIHITVYKVREVYLALIQDGWCAAYGPTVEAAMTRVKHRYQQEIGYFCRAPRGSSRSRIRPDTIEKGANHDNTDRQTTMATP